MVSIATQLSNQIDQATVRHERLSVRLKRRLAETEALLQRCEEILAAGKEETDELITD